MAVVQYILDLDTNPALQQGDKFWSAFERRAKQAEKNVINNTFVLPLKELEKKLNAMGIQIVQQTGAAQKQVSAAAIRRAQEAADDWADTMRYRAKQVNADISAVMAGSQAAINKAVSTGSVAQVRRAARVYERDFVKPIIDGQKEIVKNEAKSRKAQEQSAKTLYQREAELRSRVERATNIPQNERDALNKQIKAEYAKVEKDITNLSGAEARRRVEIFTGEMQGRINTARRTAATLRNQQAASGARTNKQVQQMFNIQQAFEDFNYAGIRGLSNNVSFLAASMGGHAGLVALLGLTAYHFGDMAYQAYQASGAVDTLVASQERYLRMQERQRELRAGNLAVTEGIYEGVVSRSAAESHQATLRQRELAYLKARNNLERVGGDLAQNRVNVLEEQERELEKAQKYVATQANWTGREDPPEGYIRYLRQRYEQQYQEAMAARAAEPTGGVEDIQQGLALARWSTLVNKNREAYISQLESDIAQTRQQYGSAGSQSTDELRKRVSEMEKELRIQEELLAIERDRAAEQQRIREANRKLQQAGSDPFTSIQQTPQERIQRQQEENRRRLQDRLDQVREDMQDAVARADAEQAAAQARLNENPPEDERQQLLAVVDAQKAARQGAIDRAESAAKSYRNEAEAADQLLQALKKIADQHEHIRKRQIEVRDGFVDKMYGGAQAAISNQTKHQLKEIENQYKRFNNMVDASSAPEKAKKYWKAWAEAQKGALERYYEGMGERNRDAAMRMQIGGLQGSALSTLRAGRQFTAMGASDKAQAEYERAIKYWEKIQDLQLGAVGQGTPQQDQQYLKAARYSQRQIERILEEMRASAVHSQGMELKHITSVQEQKTEAANISMIGQVDFKALDAYGKQLQTIIDTKRAAGITGPIGSVTGVPSAGGSDGNALGFDPQRKPVIVVDQSKQTPVSVSTGKVPGPVKPLPLNQNLPKPKKQFKQFDPKKEAEGGFVPGTGARWEADQKRADRYEAQAREQRKRYEAMSDADRYGKPGADLRKRFETWEAMAKKLRDPALNPNHFSNPLPATYQMPAGTDMSAANKLIDDAKKRYKTQLDMANKSGFIGPDGQPSMQDVETPVDYFSRLAEEQREIERIRKQMTDTAARSAMGRNSPTAQQAEAEKREKEAREARAKERRRQQQLDADLRANPYKEASGTINSNIERQKKFQDFAKDNRWAPASPYGSTDAFMDWWTVTQQAQQTAAAKQQANSIDTIRPDEVARANALAEAAERALRAKAAMGGVGGTPAGVVGQRASGGVVGRGNPYLVGERGPELFVPDSAGAVINALRTSQTMNQSALPISASALTGGAGRGGNGGGTRFGTVNVTLSGGHSVEAMQAAIARQQQFARLRRG